MIHKKSYSWMLTIAIVFMATVSIHAQTSPGGVSNGLSLWLKSDEGVTVNGANELTQWSDQSTSLHSETITGTPDLQENGLNFNPVINFIGNGSEYISFNNFASSWTEGAGFIVVRAENDPHSAGNDTGLWVVGGNTAAETNYPWTNGSIYEGFGASSTSRTVVNPAQPLDEFHIYNVFVDPAETGQTQQVFLDAALLDSHNVTPSFGSPSNVRIGRNSESSRSFDGEIAEVALYSNNASASERQQIQSYLAIKYGIALDQTTPTNYLSSDASVIWDAIINATYSNDVTGIGRDDLTVLNQKQSKSVNSDALVTIGLGAIATTNAENSNSFDTDKNFLVWGNDNGSASVQTTELPVGATAAYRIGREWKVQETGNVANLTLAFDVKETAYDPELYIDTDGDGDFANATVVTGTVVNGKAVFTGVDLNNAELFTVGYTVPSPGGLQNELSAWFKADAGVYSDAGNTEVVAGTNNVQEWHDLSFNPVFIGNQPQETNTGDKPSYVANGVNFNPSLYFEGANDRLRTPTAFYSEAIRDVAGQKATVYVIGNNTGSDGTFMDHGNTAGDNFIVKTDLASFGQSSNLNYTNNVGAQFQLISGVRSGSGTLNMYLDGLANGTQTDGDVVSANRIFTIGTNHSNLTELTGNISEIIVFRDGHDATEHNMVQSYLAIKYGITLDQSAPTNYLASDASVIWDATINATYNNNITGIGRDDISTLNQKQSKSVNSDALVTIGLGAIATTNAENSNSFDTDKNFLVWGNDNGSTSVQTTELPAGATAAYRIGREWKVQETGNMANLTLAFDVKETAYDPELYIDTDGDGDFANATVVTGTVVNGKAVFTGVDLNNAELFTVGYTVPSPGGLQNELSAWFKADAGVYSDAGNTEVVAGTNNVQEWHDLSFNPVFIGNQPQETDTGDKPSYVAIGANFNPTLYFEGSGDALRTSSAFDSDAIRDVAGENASVYIIGNGVGTFTDHGDAGSGNFIVRTDRAAFGQSSNVNYTNLVDTQFQLISGVRSGSGTLNMYLDGVANGTNTDGDAATTNRIFTIGTNDNNNFQLTGNISEIIVFRDGHVATEQNMVQSYLAIKYGITLDQTTPTNYSSSDASVIWDATANTGYSNDITGIGRDDLTALNQKQSKSINDDAMVTIGLGEIATTNALNGNVFGADKDFLLWGNDGGSTDLQITELPSSAAATMRLGREWKVAETGNVSNLTIAFSDTGINASAFNLELFIDTDGDGDFGNATVVTGGTYSAGVISFAGVDLNDGDVFTLGVTVPAPGGIIGGLNLWLRADKGAVVASGEVTTWEDQAKSFNATALSSSYQADFTENSRNFNPGLTFDGSGGFYNLPTGIIDNGNTNYAMISVMTKSGANRGTILSFGKTLGASYANKIITYEIDQNNQFTSTWYANIFSAGTVALNEPVVYTATYNNTSGRAMRKDGLVVGTNSSTALNYVQEPSKNMIGAYNAYTSRAYSFSGEMNEIIVYNATTTSAVELQRIESYLAVKYGITLDQSTPQDYLASDASVIWDATTYATFGNDIAGIGRDDGSDLLQKQSKSVNSDALVTIGLGEITITNALNGNTFDTDKDFLLWGNDNASTAVVNTGIPRVFSEKIARNWLVNETGAVGNTVVRIPDSAIAGFGGTTELALFVADDAAFATNLVTVPLVQNGANWEATIDFDGIKYFSFGIIAPNEFMRHGKSFQNGMEQPMKF